MTISSKPTGHERSVVRTICKLLDAKGQSLVLAVIALVAVALAQSDAWAGGRQLVPSDGLQIHVVNQGDLDTQTRIGADGTIVFPYAGRIKAAGLTEDQLASKIKDALAKAAIVKDPQVIVSTTSFGTQVAVSGAVRAPSVFAVDRPTTLTEALTRAGGLVEGAEKITIKHRTAKGWTISTANAKDLFLRTNNDLRSERRRGLCHGAVGLLSLWLCGAPWTLSHHRRSKRAAGACGGRGYHRNGLGLAHASQASTC